jgi:hypothetical protein
MVTDDISIEIIDQIEQIKNNVFSGKLSLIDLKLSPIFQKLKDTLNLNNLINYSKPFEGACGLLSEKFEELQNLLNTLQDDEIFLKFLKKNPSDDLIASFFIKSWREVFYLESMSLKFLNYSNNRFSYARKMIETIEHLQIQDHKENFLLQIPEHEFTEKMERYFDQISHLLPCKFEELFAKQNDQIKIYEHFVYVLHLIQLGIMKYDKEENLVYR